ncbi:MAG: hypothetical protein EBQ92_07130 [Proteobacteria bacterium]|jgi:hypothetical protein|nr:hypothetical protein [Pseudomonadota bacterium]
MSSKEKTKSMLKNLIVFGLLCASVCFAQLEVAFLEVKNAKGEIVQLEPDFPYAHVVILWDDKALHSHPRTGVAWSNPSDLDQFGTIKETLSIEPIEDFEQLIERWIGHPYDSRFSWEDDAFYCSELVAKVLGLSPEPMHFDPNLWPPSFSELEGKPGISPGKIYRKILGRAFSF